MKRLLYLGIGLLIICSVLGFVYMVVTNTFFMGAALMVLFVGVLAYALGKAFYENIIK